MMNMICPECGTELKMRKIRDEFSATFYCPYCNKELEILFDEKTFPSNIKSFNWGAFALWPIWGFWNGMPYLFFVNLSLNSFSCILLTIGLSFYYGFRGNRLSWNKKKWSSIDNFERYQSEWEWAGKIYTGVAILALGYLLTSDVF